jgi:hypothetical protein
MGDERGDAWRREWERQQAQQGPNQWPPKQPLQNQLGPIGQSHPYNQQPYDPGLGHGWPPPPPNQLHPPGYSPLSEADVQRIAIAVVARLEALRAAADRL